MSENKISQHENELHEFEYTHERSGEYRRKRIHIKTPKGWVLVAALFIIASILIAGFVMTTCFNK